MTNLDNNSNNTLIDNRWDVLDVVGLDGLQRLTNAKILCFKQADGWNGQCIGKTGAWIAKVLYNNKIIWIKGWYDTLNRLHSHHISCKNFLVKMKYCDECSSSKERNKNCIICNKLKKQINDDLIYSCMEYLKTGVTAKDIMSYLIVENEKELIAFVKANTSNENFE